MSEQTKSLLGAALALPDTDRAFLAERLLDSLPASRISFQTRSWNAN
jgi:hypothetical protein